MWQVLDNLQRNQCAGARRPEQARHTHLRSYHGNLKNVCVCVWYFRSGAHSFRGNPINVWVCMYVHICICVYICMYIILSYWWPSTLYVVNVDTSISGVLYTSSGLPWIWVLCIVVFCHLVAFHETPTFSLMTLHAIWWRNEQAVRSHGPGRPVRFAAHRQPLCWNSCTIHELFCL